jgi:2-polyprenyl-6-methoxyphenol hydroxylase-like FAD-dependent oxidoreductase
VRVAKNIGIGGGGIGGIAAAAALRQIGIDVGVYEKAPELREVGAGMMLWPNATRVLRELGLLENVLAQSGPNTHFLVRRSCGKIPDAACGRKRELQQMFGGWHEPIADFLEATEESEILKNGARDCPPLQ